MATTYANYESFGHYADEISSLSFTAYNKVKNAYESVASLNNPNGWKGVNYDKLVTSFNDMVENFNLTFREIQDSIPSAIRSIASLYASFDTSSVSRAIDDSNKISTIPLSNTTALTFEIENVKTSKDSVERNLTESKENMVSIKDTINKMNTDWQGEEYEDIREKIVRYVDQLDSNMTTLIKDLNTYFDETNSQYIVTKSKVQDTLQVN